MASDRYDNASAAQRRRRAGTVCVRHCRALARQPAEPVSSTGAPAPRAVAHCRSGAAQALLALLAMVLGLGAAPVDAQPLLAALREQVVMVPKATALGSIALEVTLYRPPGDGPFPVVLINHGKAAGDTRFQSRARYETPAREFVQRDYMVVIPMRQGFSRSGGSYIGAGCNVESNGRVQALDVAATLDYLKTVPDADLSRVVVAGQSHGGLTTLAFGTQNYPGVRALLNFAGGLRQDQCPGWEASLARAFGAYGSQTTVPSLWFYGENDSFWQPWLIQAMHHQYQQSGGKATLVDFGSFGTDAHAMFGSREGRAIWLAPVEQFLAAQALPTRKLHHLAPGAHEGPVPESTGFAALQDEKALPHVRQGGQGGYLKFLQAEGPRAFAISPRGAWGYVSDRADAMPAALERCNQNVRDSSCRLYAVDDRVVWSAAAP